MLGPFLGMIIFATILHQSVIGCGLPQQEGTPTCLLLGK